MRSAEHSVKCVVDSQPAKKLLTSFQHIMFTGHLLCAILISLLMLSMWSVSEREVVPRS